jgi:hypothetical protein
VGTWHSPPCSPDAGCHDQCDPHINCRESRIVLLSRIKDVTDDQLIGKLNRFDEHRLQLEAMRELIMERLARIK